MKNKPHALLRWTVSRRVLRTMQLFRAVKQMIQTGQSIFFIPAFSKYLVKAPE